MPLRHALLFAGLTAVLAMTKAHDVRAAGGEDSAASDRSTIEIAYELYAGGVTMGEIDVAANMSDADYRISSDLVTRGLVNRFWQAKLQGASSGTKTRGRLVPSLYDSYSETPRRTQQLTLTYGPAGPNTTANKIDPAPGFEADQGPPLPVIPDEEKRDTLDPLSAILFIASGQSIDTANPCGIKAPVYDGRRRYDITLTFVKTDRLDMDNRLYSGPVTVCEVGYRPIAGAAQSLVRQRPRMPPIYAMLARMPNPKDPARPYFFPLRLWTDTDFGRVVALATRLTVDGSALGPRG